VAGGFQAWIGSECVYICLKAIWPSIEERIPNHMAQSTNVTTAQFLGYIIFMLISMSFIYIRPHRLQTLLYVSAPIVMVFIVVLLIWSLATMGPQGFGETISMSSGWNILLGNLVTLFRVKPSSFPLMLSLAVSLESLLRERPNDDTDKPIGTCPTFFGQ